MKKIFPAIFVVLLLVLSAEQGFGQDQKSSFDFRSKKVENSIIEARFQLTNEIDLKLVKPEILKLYKVVSFNELKKEHNYYQLRYYSVTDLEEVRKLFKSFNTDFELKFISVKNKSYYKN